MASLSACFEGTPLDLGDVGRGEHLLMPEEARRLHTHVIGATGTGKTKFIEYLIRQDIEQEQGVCVIDPTGNLYNNLVRWCETHYLQDEREIILIDPTEDEWVFGFNPLAFGGSVSEMDSDRLAFGTAATRAAIQRAWGEGKNVSMPLLRRLLNMLIYTLAEHHLTIAEGQLLMHPDANSLVRHYLTSNLQNLTALREWESVASIKPHDYENLFGSVRNRLFEFLLQPRLASMTSQTTTIDFRHAMDAGQVVLVNLSTGGNRVHPDIGNLIGSLIVNSIVLAARSRTNIAEEERRPFYLYIDECHRYLNDDIAEILDELRQFGLHLTLAHQNLTQLREDGSERIYASIMSNASTKVVFRCPDEYDADTMAKRIFRGAIDLEEPKHTFDKPAPTGQFDRERLVAETQTTSAGAPTNSVTTSTDADGNVTRSITEGEGPNTTSSATSTHETLVPVYDVYPGAAYSLPEQYERKAAHIATLWERHAIIKLPETPAVEVVVPNVEEGYANDERVKRFKRQVYERYEFIVPRIEADRAMQERGEQLRLRALKHASDKARVIEGELLHDDFDPWANK